MSRRRPRTLSRPPGEPSAIGWAYVAPGFVVYALFLLWPLVRAGQYSLYSWDGLGESTFAGIDNYVTVFTDEALRAAFGHAFTLVAFFALIPLAIGLVLAAILNRARVKGLAFFRTVVFLPQVIAMVAIGVAWRQIYEPDGGLNQLLRGVGLGRWATGWLGEYDLALPAVGLVGTWFETGLVTVLLMAGMGRVERDVYEAARLDGATFWTELRYVTLPSVRGEIGVALTMTVIAAFKTFDLVYVMTKGGPGHQTTVPSYEVYRQAFEIGQVGVASAVGVVLTAVIFSLSAAIQRIGRQS